MKNNTASDTQLKEINEFSRNTLSSNLGIEITHVSDGRVEGRMPADKRTIQPFGYLHGGASLAMAESMAGIGTRWITGAEQRSVGMEVSGNHLRPVPEGHTVTAICSIIHRGKKTHVWNTEIYDGINLISVIRVVYFILDKND